MIPSPISPFSSFFMGGFECSSHRRSDGRRLDLIAATGHDHRAAEDYALLGRHGLLTGRDGLRWHLIENEPGHYDWSSALPLLRAARAAGVQVIWDLCHYGWPDHLDIFSPDFVASFARFAAAAATLIEKESDGPVLLCPVNEMSYWSWAGGDMALMNPHRQGRGFELKLQLARACLAATDAVRAVVPGARIMHAEPAIHVIADPARPQEAAAAEAYRLLQYQSLDLISGRFMPELGGSAVHLDIIGVNYYWNNQWILGGDTIDQGHPHYQPLRSILAEVYQRYGRPVFLSETGVEGPRRPGWLAFICDEVQAALAAGVPVLGICLYPITNYTGWEDERLCITGLFDGDGRAPWQPYVPLLAELERQQERFAAFSMPPLKTLLPASAT